MSAIIKAKGNDGTEYFYGPFADGDHATTWGGVNLKGFDWCWEDLIRPGSTYLTCSIEDLKDFIEPIVAREETCYVSVAGANWAVTH